MYKSARRLPRAGWASGIVAMTALSLLANGPSRLFAQPVFRAAPVARPAPAPAGAKELLGDSAESERKFPGGAPLKTDPEQEQLLIRAEQFASDGRYDLAAVLWQKVLDQSGDTLFTRDGRTYFGLSAEVERILKELADEALKVYRITADGEAQAVLAAADKQGEETALATVVRRYFVSSLGDDAAFRLGCMALDRHDFVGAYRLFTKVLEQHPDPSMPREQLLLRLAVACARIGDHAAAQAALAQVDPSAGDAGEGVYTEVKREVEKARVSATARSTHAQEFRMTLGGPERRGVMPALPPELTSASLRELWTLSFPIVSSGPSSDATRIGRMRFGRQNTAVVNPATTPETLIDRWRQNGWSPAGQLLFADGKVFIKTNNDLACWDLASPVEKPVWRSTWLNAFQIDPHTQSYLAMGLAQMNPKRPMSPPEIQFFGDRVAQSMSIAGGLVFNLEGPRVARHSGARQNVGANNPQQMPGFQYGVTPRRSRKNWLAAYELATGRARWRRGADDTAKNDDTEVGFMAAPVPYGRLLLAPVTDGGAIWLHALKAQDGATVWKTYLCDEPSGGCAPWSPVCVAVSGSDAYVLCGAGVVFSIDAVSGAIRYAVRYERNGDPDERLRSMGYPGGGLLNLKGFDDDAAIPFGRALIVMPSDHDGLFAIDRRTGEVLWRTPRTPFERSVSYCLGLVDGGLYVAGPNVVRKYDAAGGKLLWEQETAETFGRGALTTDAVYVPIKGQVGGAVLKLDLATGKVLAQAGVTLSENQVDAPLGNLYSDGEKIWILSGHRVSMLADDQYERRVLDRRIESGDRAALLERARLSLSLGEVDDAIADLEAAHSRQDARRDGGLVADSVCSVLAELRLIDSRPLDALKVLARLAALERTAGRPLGESLVAQLRGVTEALTSVESSASVPLLLEIVDALPEESWSEVSRAIARSVKNEHSPLLKESLARSPGRFVAAADGLAIAEGAAAAELFQARLGDENVWVRLAAARALARAGDRRSLPALVELLGAESPLVRAQADFLLRRLLASDVGYDPFAADDELRRTRQWADFLAGEGAARELAAFPAERPSTGYTLVCCPSQNSVIEFDRQGKERWKATVPGAWSCQLLPDGRRLVAMQPNLLVEFGADGAETWRSEPLPGVAAGIERLPTGNILVVCPDAQKVVEISAKGGLAWEYSTLLQPTSVQRLPGGTTLFAGVAGDDGRAIEVSPSGKELRVVAGLAGVLRARRLPTGGLLVVQSGLNRVSEIDNQGKVIWELKNLNTPTDAWRLPSGSTLIVEASRVFEIDAQGNTVLELPVAGAMAASRN